MGVPLWIHLPYSYCSENRHNTKKLIPDDLDLKWLNRLYMTFSTGPVNFVLKIDFLIRNLVSSPQRDISPFSFPQATLPFLPAEFLVNLCPFILITALVSETNGRTWLSLETFGS
jgi:hypothetical protein